MLLEQARERDDRLDRRDWSSQILAQRLLVTLWSLLGSAVVAIEEVARALEILEDAQVVVARLPGVRDEEPNRVGLRHARPSLAQGRALRNLRLIRLAWAQEAPSVVRNGLPDTAWHAAAG